MIKAIFFDIDGTLVSHTVSDIPSGVLDALDMLRGKGIRLFLATGRHISEFPSLPLHDYPFDGYVTQTGQICYDRYFNTLYEQPFTVTDSQKLVEFFDQKEVPIVLLNSRSLYINFVNDFVIRTQQAIDTPLPPTGNYGGESLFGATVFGTPDDIGKIIDALPDCIESRWNEYASDIVLRQAGKVSGIRKFLQHYQIEQSETMVFGDADNDVDMIRFAGIGIAMGNGSDLAKANADYITASVDDNGILLALRRYQLIT